MAKSQCSLVDQSIGTEGQPRHTSSDERVPPPEIPRLINRLIIQADRIDRLIAALRDCQLQLAAAKQRDAAMAERAASTTWRIVETISRVNARIAPRGSGRRSLLRVGCRTLRAISRFRSPRYAARRIRSVVDGAFHKCFHAVVDPIGFHREVWFNPPHIPRFSTIRASIIIFSDSTHGIDTLSCLKSIVSHDAGIGYEVIVFGESLTWWSWRRLKRISGLVVLQSRRFTESLALSIAGATVGDYLVFIDSAARVTPGWLAALVETFHDHPLAGMAVPKLLHPGGRLKDPARVISGAPGASLMLSVDPDHPRNNFVRELDSCSPACVIVPRNVFKQFGGLDHRRRVDGDAVIALSSTIRHAGKKLIYQPMATIIHCAPDGQGYELTSLAPIALANHRPHFQGSPTSTKSPGQVLVIDHWLPTPDKDAGSLRMMEILKAIRRRGHHVAFVPASMVRALPYAQNLQRLGVEVVYQHYYQSVEDYLERHGREFELVIISRADIASRYMGPVREFAPRAKLVFDTVDLHFVRQERASLLLNDPGMRRAARRRKRQELAIACQCDATLVVSPVEKAILESECPGIDVRLLPNVMDVPRDEPPGYEDRRYLLFVGGFGHDPNVDAVIYFVSQVLPLVVERLPDLVFQVVGSDTPASIRDLAGTNVEILGFVPDVKPLFNSARVSVAPLRFGAGVKGKVNQSMAYGVPTVVTSIAAEGMHLVHEVTAMIADDPANFADAVVRLWTDKMLWEQISANGRESVREHFSVETAYRRIDELLAFAGVGRFVRSGQG